LYGPHIGFDGPIHGALVPAPGHFAVALRCVNDPGVRRRRVKVMERLFDAYSWLIWLMASAIGGVVTVLGLIYWWLTHPVDDEAPPSP
jgi:hypothetical protein